MSSCSASSSPRARWSGPTRWRRAPLCIGTSLEVHPIAQLPSITRQCGGAVAIVTQGETPWDDRAVVKLDGDVEVELRAVVAALGLEG